MGCMMEKEKLDISSLWSDYNKLKEENLNLNAELLKYNSIDYKEYLNNKEKEKETSIQIEKIKSKISKLYIILPINIIAIIVLLVIGFIIKSILMVVLVLLLGTPIFILSIIFFIIKLYRDLKKIKNFAIKKLSSNYIIARFFYSNKKIDEVYFRVSGNELKYSGGLYFIDEKAIYFNQDNKPIIDYDFNLPNPRIYSNKNILELYNNAKDKREIKDKNGYIVDLSYSSETIQDFKKDKLFKEFHSGGSAETLSAITILGIIIILVLVLYMVMSK